MEQLGNCMVGIAVGFAAINWFIVIFNSINRKTTYPPVPLLGGLVGFVGCLLSPQLRIYCLLPVLLDPGSGLVLLIIIPNMIWEGWRTSSANLMSEYVCTNEFRKVSLRLFRQNVFTLQETSFDESRMERHLSGSWSRSADELTLKFGDQEASFIVDGNQLQRTECDTKAAIEQDVWLAGLKLEQAVPAKR